MSFEQCDKEVGVGMFTSLADDGDTMDMIFLAEPVPREESYMGATRKRAYFPVLTSQGLQVWGVGAKTYRYLREAWVSVHNRQTTVTRVGKKGSTETRYTFKYRTP